MSSDDDITPRFHRGLTLFLALVLCSFLCLSGSSRNLGPVYVLEHPAETAREHFEARIELEEALAAAPAWQRRALALFTGVMGSAREEALAAWSEVIASQADALHDPKPQAAADGAASDPQAPAAAPAEPVSPTTAPAADDGGGFLACARTAIPKPPLKDDRATLTELLARLGVLQGEAGRFTELRATRARLEQLDAAAIAGALEHAYRPFAADDARDPASFDVSLLREGWARERLALRLAERSGDAALRDGARAERERRESALRARSERLLYTGLVPTIAGLLALLAWLLWNRPPLPKASVSVPPPWTFEDGFAVVTRAFLYGLLLVTVLGFVGSKLSAELQPLIHFLLLATLPLPAIVLVRRALLAPRGLSFAHAFGLRSLGRPAWAWVLVVLALFAADQAGSALILDLCERLGERPSWTDLAHEWLHRPHRAWTIAFVALTLTWFPLANELFGRGVLFLTLRARMAAFSAAIWSAALAAAFHNASLPEYLSIVWSGLLFALAVEHTRSLWPSIACIALSQGLAYALAFQLG